MAKRPFREYSKRDMKNALLELKKNGSKLLSVSKKYKIPRSTLRRLRKKELLSPEKMGPPTLLTTQEEDILVAWLLELKDRGFPVNREQLIATVKNLLDKSERKVEKFVDNRPGQKWVDLFEKRHPEITLRTPQQLVKRRSDITKEDIENWFDETKDYLQKNNWFDVLSDPSRIFNCDEAAFLMNPKGNRVYAGKGDKTVYHVSGDDKECITVLFMISAADIQLPPMLVFKYERIPYDLTLKIPAHWAVGRSPETGWMTCCTFYEYISNVFYPWLIQNKVTLPVILFLDGHVSHMSPLLSEFCSDRGIILFAFVPNATHIQQPCDVSLFRPLKSIWKEEVRKWKDENEEFSLSKKDCAPILQKAFDRIEFSVIRNGFRTCGLYPFDKNAIDYKKLLKKNSEATSNTSEIVAETPSSFKKHLQFIEKRISPRKLQLYKCGEAGGDDSLYQFWQKLHDDATGSSFTSNSSTFLQSSTNSFENSTSSDNLQLPSPSEIAAPLNLPFTESVVMSTPSADISGLSTSNSAQVATSTPLADISGLNASNSTSVAVSTPLADIPGPSNSNNAPKNIPSPFKNLLPWPIVMKKKNGSKSTRNKEKLPYAVTSAEWQSYHKKKELEKEKLEKEKADRKDMRLQKKKEKEEKQKQSKGQKSKKKSKCTIVRSIESESEEDDPKWFSDPSDSESFSDEDINDTHHSHETKIEVGTYLLMKLKTEDNKEDVYYVAVVLAVNEKSLSVKYFRKTEKGSFKLPPIEDVGDVSYEKIEKILPAPIPGSTRRQKDIIKFNFDFATLNLR